MRHGNRQIHHFATLQVDGEDVFGRAQHQLPDGDTVQILQLFDLGQQVRHLPQVANVDAAIVHRLRQGDSVHGGRGVVQTVANLKKSTKCVKPDDGRESQIRNVRKWVFGPLTKTRQRP